MKLVLVYILATCYYSQSVELPAYIMSDRCSSTGPNLSRCIEESANKIIPQFVEGLESFDIPNMLPLKLKEVPIRNDESLQFILKNVEVYGLQNTRMTDVKANFIENTFTYSLVNPKLDITGDYEMKGDIANIPVKGHGKMFISLFNGTCSTDAKCSVDENQFAKNITIQLSISTEYNFYHFTGLTVGNETNENPTNAFINYHSKEVNNNLNPGASIVMTNFIQSVFQKINTHIPLTTSYLP